MTSDQHRRAFDWIDDHIENLLVHSLDDINAMLEQVVVSSNRKGEVGHVEKIIYDDETNESLTLRTETAFFEMDWLAGKPVGGMAVDVDVAGRCRPLHFCDGCEI